MNPLGFEDRSGLTKIILLLRMFYFRGSMVPVVLDQDLDRGK